MGRLVSRSYGDPHRLVERRDENDAVVELRELNSRTNRFLATVLVCFSERPRSEPSSSWARLEAPRTTGASAAQSVILRGSPWAVSTASKLTALA